MYKVIIFDLDGTAIPNDPMGVPSERLAQAIKNAKSKIKLCAATGRPIANAKYIIDKLELDDPCIISAGTQIINPETSKIIWETAINGQDVLSIINIARPYHYELLTGNELLGEGTKAADHSIKGSVNAMYLMTCTKADSKDILDKLSRLSEITAVGVRSWTQGHIDIHITHRSATKEHAVFELLRILGISKDESVGVGDSDNDVHLFKGVGRKIAMGNATDLLKSQADEVCESVDKDGLAKVVERLTS